MGSAAPMLLLPWAAPMPRGWGGRGMSWKGTGRSWRCGGGGGGGGSMGMPVGPSEHGGPPMAMHAPGAGGILAGMSLGGCGGGRMREAISRLGFTGRGGIRDITPAGACATHARAAAGAWAHRQARGRRRGVVYMLGMSAGVGVRCPGSAKWHTSAPGSPASMPLEGCACCAAAHLNRDHALLMPSDRPRQQVPGLLYTALAGSAA